MKPIRVNVDYESQLFYNTPADSLNHSLEFLAFFLSDRPLFTRQSYAPDYLDYVTSVSGLTPGFSTDSPAENWWGPLLDLPVERFLNSKETSAALIIDQKWCPETKIIRQAVDMPVLPADRRYILKSLWGMSGQNFFELNPQHDLPPVINKALQSGPALLEPLFERRYDFSHYVYPDGRIICYQNLVNHKFQYKGTLITNLGSMERENLSFFPQIDTEEWRTFTEKFSFILQYYRQFPLSFGFSIDSFVYQDQQKLKIRALSEVNHRKTMGRVTYELAMRYSHSRSWSRLIMGKTLKNFSLVKARLQPLLLTDNSEAGIIILSPGTRFEMFFVTAVNATLGEQLLKELERLLPEAQLAVKIQ